MAPADLAAMAKAVAEDLTAPAEAKGITLTAKTEPAEVLGMPDALRLMITNLTDNAIRYTPEGGRIEIGIAADGKDAVISGTAQFRSAFGVQPGTPSQTTARASRPKNANASLSVFTGLWAPKFQAPAWVLRSSAALSRCMTLRFRLKTAFPALTVPDAGRGLWSGFPLTAPN